MTPPARSAPGPRVTFGLIISANYPSDEGFAERIAVLHHGRLAFDGPVIDQPYCWRRALLNQPPGPETRWKARSPGPSCAAGVSPGRSPFPVTRDFYCLRPAQHKRFPPAISRIFLIHMPIHILRAVIPRGRAFSTESSTAASTGAGK